jgi:hypothetical protein
VIPWEISRIGRKIVGSLVIGPTVEFPRGTSFQEFLEKAGPFGPFFLVLLLFSFFFIAK